MHKLMQIFVSRQNNFFHDQNFEQIDFLICSHLRIQILSVFTIVQFFFKIKESHANIKLNSVYGDVQDDLYYLENIS